MFSATNAQKVAEKLNELLAISGDSVPEYEKFNMQFMGNDTDFSIDTDDETRSDFVNPCALVKLSMNCRRVLNYIYYHNKGKNNKLRKITDDEIAVELGISIKTVGTARRRLSQLGLIVRQARSLYIVNFEVRDDKDYFYINKLWFNTVFDFDIEVNGITHKIRRPLKPFEVMTLLAITRHYTYSDVFYEASQRRLAGYINCSPSTVGNCFRSLENGGLMRRCFMKNGKVYDSLGVNDAWLTYFVINEDIVNLAKATQSDATKQPLKENQTIAEKRIVAFTMSNYPEATRNKIQEYANVYLERIKERCKSDFTYQELRREQKEIIELYNKGEIDGVEGGRRLKKILHRQRAYLQSKGLPRQALEWQYQERRAKRYLVSSTIRPPKQKPMAVAIS